MLRSVPRVRVDDDDRVEQVWVFGSWARRFHGERGRLPNDVNLIVVSELSPFELALPLYDIGFDLNIELNPVYRYPNQFDLDDPLWADTPMVQIK